MNLPPSVSSIMGNLSDINYYFREIKKRERETKAPVDEFKALTNNLAQPAISVQNSADKSEYSNQNINAVGGFFCGAGRYINTSFIESIQLNGLVDSYNSSNSDSPIPEGGDEDGNTIGVRQKEGLIKGLFSSHEELIEKQHLFYISTIDGKTPFKMEELHQIVRELSIGIFAYDSIPCISLHYNSDNDIYSVLHPCYQKTLVGRVIGILDYYLKGFLNGALFGEAFVKEWNNSKTLDESIFNTPYIDLNKYCQIHLGRTYSSIPEILDTYDLFSLSSSESPLLSDYSGFRSSFNIIAKQNSINKTENMFILDGDFDVEFTIRPDPVYLDEMKKYRTEHGRDPKGYTKLVEAYEKMKHQIKNIMPALPICRDLFEMLKVINFFSYYFKTLKLAQKIPVFETREKDFSFSCPILFPQLPIRQMKLHRIKVDLGNLFINLSEEQNQFIEKYLKNTTDFSVIPQDVFKVISPHFLNCLEESFPLEKLSSWSFAKHIKAVLEMVASDLESSVLRYNYFILYDIINNLDSSVTRLKAYKIKIEDQKIQASITSSAFSLEYNDLLFKKMCDDKIDQVKRSIRNFSLIYNEILPILKSEKIFIESFSELIGKSPKGKGEEISKRKELIVEKLQNIIATSLDEEILQIISVGILGLKDLKTISILDSVKGNKIGLNVNRSAVQLFTELNEDDKQLTKRLMSGCGMKMKPIFVKHNSTKLDILESSIFDVMKANVEEWIPVGIDSDKKATGFVFKMNIMDYSATSENDYTWMQTLLTPNSSERLAIKAAAFNAFEYGDMDLVKGHIKNKESLYAKDPNGFSLMHYAAVTPNADFIRELYEAGASLNDTDPFGYTPLHLAAGSGLLLNVQLLLKLNSQVLHCKSLNSATALNLAVQKGQIDCMRILLEYGADVNNRMTHGMTPLYTAIHHGHELLALELLDVEGVDVNCALEDGTTPLYLAVETGQLRIIEKLIAKKADILKARIDSYTPIHIAAKKGSLEVCQLLFKHLEVDPNLPLKSGQTILHLAVEYNHPSVVMFFLKAGTQITNFGWDKESALHTAVKLGNIEAFHILLSYSQVQVEADSQTFSIMNLPDIYGVTPLKSALKYRFYEIIEALLHNGAILPEPLEFLLDLCEAKVDPLLIQTWIDQNSFTKKQLKEAYYIAAKHGHNQMIAIFQSIYQVEDFIDDKGWTVAHFGAKFDNTSSIIRYLKKVPDHLEKDSNRKTLSAIAVEHGSNRVLKLLLDDIQKRNFSLADHYQESHLLFPAIVFNEPLCAESILNYVTSPNIILDSMGRTAVHLATIHGDVEMLEFLRLRGCTFDIKDKEGKTAFHYAFEYNWSDTIDYLFNKKYEISISQEIIDDLLVLGTEDQRKILLKLGFSSSLTNDNNQIANSNQANEKNVKKEIETDFDQMLRALKVPNPECLLKALTQNQNVDVEDDDGFTLLFYAISLKHLEQIDILLKKGANPNHQSKNRSTPLSDAILIRSHFICKLLIKYEANVNQSCFENLQTPLHLAAKHGDLDIVKTLIISGANLHKVDLNGKHPIHFAALAGHLPLVKLMLTMGASLHAKDYTGRTLFHYAAESKNPDLIAFLKTEGLSLQKQTKIRVSSFRKSHYQPEGVTPLHLSVENGHPAIVRQLLDAGADMNVCDKYNRGILFFTLIGGKVEVLNIFTNLTLMDNIAHKINAIQGAIRKDAVQYLEILYNDTPLDLCLDSNGATALHIAVSEGSRRCLHYLVKNGADPLKAALKGDTSFDLAVKTEQLALARYIAKKTLQLDLHRKLKEGKTYLHIACKKNDVEMASWLISKGLSIDEIDNHGLTPMHYAAKQGSQPLMHLFLAVGGDPFKLTLQNQSLVELLPSKAKTLTQLVKKYESERIRNLDKLDSIIHMAIRLDDIKHFPLLLKVADKNHGNRARKTPLHLAILHDNPYFFLNLIDKGADLELQDYKGRTPLFLAVSKGWNLDYVQSLIKLNANLMIKDVKGRSLFDAISDRKDDIEFSLELFDLLFTHLSKEEKQNSLYAKLRDGMEEVRLEAVRAKKAFIKKLLRQNRTSKNLQTLS